MLLSQGCVHGPTIAPPGWVAVDAARPATAPIDDRGLLQVFICYGQGMSSHAALRIGDAGGAVVFWDPGGACGTDPEDERRRVACLLPDDPPTVAEYFRYRTGWCGEEWMEVFEWRLDPAEATALQAVLTEGQSHAFGGRVFDTETKPLACSLAVSAFLQRFRPAGITVRARHFWPHNLAAELWTQDPDVVWEYREGETVRGYRRGVVGSS